MPSYQVKLAGREQLAKGTLVFRFETPAGFTFKAGRAVVLELLDPPAGDGQKRRTFSLVSAPFESTLAIAARMRDTAFKRALKALPDGASVKLSGPIDQFTLADAARPAVSIAGGIGITPFMSMLREANRERSTQSFLLLYSNRRGCRIPRRAAGARAEQRQLPAVRHDDRHGELRAQVGRRKRLAQRGRDTALCVGGLAAPVYYVVGPPAMVVAMQETLCGMGIAESDIRSEEFYGY
ncbi:MAG TPA: FAD-dependent oxidoreductase [Burkholderiales bacterium]|nr:FAD-dependent oxidoreductase [Burkholderiales bacterium]